MEADTCSMAVLGLGCELASGSSMQDPDEAADRGECPSNKLRQMHTYATPESWQ
jgi:hypothetical protein